MLFCHLKEKYAAFFPVFAVFRRRSFGAEKTQAFVFLNTCVFPGFSPCEIIFSSLSNFIYFDTGKDPAWIQEQLMKKGIRIGAFEMSRVSVGTMEECKLYIKALKEILEAAE